MTNISFSAVTCAFPSHQITQDDVIGFAQEYLKEHPAFFERMRPAFDNAGINTRYSAVPLHWYLDEHSWPERTKIFHDNAIPMLEQAGKEAIAEADIDPKEIGSVITVCSTGIMTPSLEAHLIPTLGLSPNVVRLPIFGLGCAGGVAAMARATDLCRAGRGPVLILVVELCGLTFRAQDKTKSNVIATALFGDGAAAAVIGGHNNVKGHFVDFQEYLWPDSLGVMGWRVEDDSLGVIFSRDIPNLVTEELAPIVKDYLAKHHYSLNDIDGLILHPGGTRVLDAYSHVFGNKLGIDASRHVLSQYGNMSSVTILAVLRDMLKNHTPQGTYLAGALGPGFTSALGLVELLGN